MLHVIQKNIEAQNINAPGCHVASVWEKIHPKERNSHFIYLLILTNNLTAAEAVTFDSKHYLSSFLIYKQGQISCWQKKKNNHQGKVHAA